MFKRNEKKYYFKLKRVVEALMWRGRPFHKLGADALSLLDLCDASQKI